MVGFNMAAHLRTAQINSPSKHLYNLPPHLSEMGCFTGFGLIGTEDTVVNSNKLHYKPFAGRRRTCSWKIALNAKASIKLIMGGALRVLY